MKPSAAPHGELISTVQSLNPLGINQGSAGNASVRLDDGLLITPTGMPYERLTPDDMVTVSWDGSHHCPNRQLPSSEWRFHRDLLQQRPDLGAVVHTHGQGASTIACMRKELPAFHYMVAVAGGSNVRCADYATFGTAELSARVVEAMVDRRACLLANHGLVTAGRSLAQALAVAVEIETLCTVYARCLTVGQPTILSDVEMEHVLAQFEAGIGAGPALGIER